jgi:hypothetical protein
MSDRPAQLLSRLVWGNGLYAAVGACLAAWDTSIHEPWYATFNVLCSAANVWIARKCYVAAKEARSRATQESSYEQEQGYQEGIEGKARLWQR